MTLGHVLRPFVPGPTGAHVWRRAAFVLVVAALGAWRGWREVAVRAAWDDLRTAPPRTARGAVAGALAAVLAAALGYVAVHGLGR